MQSAQRDEEKAGKETQGFQRVSTSYGRSLH
jgi:hypothetical protein